MRLKEEYTSLIKYVSNNKEADNDWFRLESNKVIVESRAEYLFFPQIRIVSQLSKNADLDLIYT